MHAAEEGVFRARINAVTATARSPPATAITTAIPSFFDIRLEMPQGVNNRGIVRFIRALLATFEVSLLPVLINQLFVDLNGRQVSDPQLSTEHLSAPERGRAYLGFLQLH